MDKRQLYVFSIYLLIGLCSQACFGQQTTPEMMNHGGMDMGAMHDDHTGPSVTQGMGDMDHMDHGDTPHMDHDHMDHMGDDVTMMDHDGMDHTGGHQGGHATDGHDMPPGGHHGGAGTLYFYASNRVQLFFEEWDTNTDKELALSVLYVVLLAIFFEGLKAFRDYVTTVEKSRSKTSHEWSYKAEESSIRKCSCCLVALHVFQSILNMLHVFISMCLMLFFMTFNAWICGAVCVGAGLGYLIFGKLRRRVNQDEENCH